MKKRNFFDSGIFRFLSATADLIVLNLLFIFCSLPILTIGPALTAMHYVTLRMVRNEESHIVKDFFRSFRQNISQGIIIHIIFSCVVCALSEGEGFITYWETHEVINGISFNTIKIVGVCLASLVPILLCRGKDFKGYLKYIISSSLVFVAVCVFEWISIFIVFYISQIANVDIIFPLNTYDSLFFAFMYFPIGGFLGTLISIIANAILSILKKKVY